MTLKWMAFLGVVLLAAHVGAEETIALKTQKDKVSYGVGVSVVRNFKHQGVEVDPDVAIQGMRDEFSGKKLLMSEEELRTILNEYQKELQQKYALAVKKAADANKKEGEAFLAENKKKNGVVSLPSGLQYKIIKEGNGKKPTETDRVECRYRGTFINGKEFDGTNRTGQPATFKVTGIIPGWREALKLMPVGSKWQLFIPPQLAYGERGAGPIGPNATLIFELELLGIK